jgi:DNA-binding beta-propeller fold protein YncE
MRSKPRGWVARNVIDGLVVLAVLVGSLWVVPRGIGGREEARPPAAATATTLPPPATSAPTAVSTSTSHPQRSAVVGSVRLKGFTQGLAFGAGSLWIASGERLARVDPARDEVLASVPIAPGDSGPAGVAFGAGAVWVPVAVPGSVWRIDPASNKVVAKIRLGESLAGFIGVAATDTAIWVSSGEQQDGQRGGILMRIDPHRNRVTARVPLPTVPSDVAATRDSVWVAMTNGQVLEIDAARGRPLGVVDTGGPLGFTQTIALGAGSVWLADPLAGVVLRVDPHSLRVQARIATGAITALAFGSGGVWAVGKPGILRIDPASSRVAAMLPAAEVEGVLMVATGAGWVWAGSAELVTRLDPKLIRS